MIYEFVNNQMDFSCSALKGCKASYGTPFEVLGKGIPFGSRGASSMRVREHEHATEQTHMLVCRKHFETFEKCISTQYTQYTNILQ